MRNKAKWMAIVAFLTAVQASLSANIKQLIDQGSVRPTDSELFIRKNMGTGANGSINLLSGVTTAEIGVTNFNGNKLDSDRIFVLDALTINYGVAADNTAVSAVDYSTALPAALKCANLVVKQNGKTLVSLPVSAIADAKYTDERYRELAGFQLLEDGKTISIELEFAAGSDFVAGAGNQAYVEVVFRGMETYINR